MLVELVAPFKIAELFCYDTDTVEHALLSELTAHEEMQRTVQLDLCRRERRVCSTASWAGYVPSLLSSTELDMRRRLNQPSFCIRGVQDTFDSFPVICVYASKRCIRWSKGACCVCSGHAPGELCVLLLPCHTWCIRARQLP
jgi:hypothetical protein